MASNDSQMCWCSAMQEEERLGPSHTVGRQAAETGGSRGAGAGAGAGAPSPSASHGEQNTHTDTHGLSNSCELNPAMRL